MDPILQNAIARRDAALAEARKWDAFIQMFAELAGQRVTAPPQVTVASPVSVPVTVRDAPAVRKSVKAAETEQVAAAVIRERGKPVSTRDLLDELVSRGVEVGGADPLATLLARLRRSPSLEHEKPFGWRLVEPRHEIGAGGEAVAAEPPNSDPVQPHSSPVEPAAGGGG